MNPEGKPQTHVPRHMPEQSLGPSQTVALGCQGVWSLPTPLFLLPTDRVLEHLSNLSREVNLEYERSMNKINFDQIVSSKPQTFSYVTLPKKEEEKVPKQGEGVGQRRPNGHPPSQSPSCPICKSDTHLRLPILSPAFIPAFRQLPGDLGMGVGMVDEGCF